jgi:hypothetical protein
VVDLERGAAKRTIPCRDGLEPTEVLLGVVATGRADNADLSGFIGHRSSIPYAARFLFLSLLRRGARGKPLGGVGHPRFAPAAKPASGRQRSSRWRDVSNTRQMPGLTEIFIFGG